MDLLRCFSIACLLTAACWFVPQIPFEFRHRRRPKPMIAEWGHRWGDQTAEMLSAIREVDDLCPAVARLYPDYPAAAGVRSIMLDLPSGDPAKEACRKAVLAAYAGAPGMPEPEDEPIPGLYGSDT